ncbi:MAG: metallophosphoesterase [Deltaproteobacteria bacterium]|jgi:hypothetical protein|nr:metallophosphoesterase [Deltaproteobacteria bacterium]
MIWAIGDIHGMFDPLKRIMSQIRFLEEADDPVERVVFLGDYIDHGPSSREVVDYLRALDLPKVLLLGNHEDMALRDLGGDKVLEGLDGDVWLDNGALDTYKSLFDRRGGMETAREFLRVCEKKRRGAREEDGRGGGRPAVPRLPRKYETFLKSLRLHHRETFELPGGTLGFSFFHALPDRGSPLDDQRFKTRAAFSRSLDRAALALREGPAGRGRFSESLADLRIRLLEGTCLWNRDYDLESDYRGEIVVHGHTPTANYPGYYDNRGMRPYFRQFESWPDGFFLPFLFALSPDAVWPDGPAGAAPPGFLGPYGNAAGCRRYRCPPGTLRAVNIDTGAVYGRALTALGLSKKYLERGLMPLLTVRTSEGQRRPDSKIMARTILVEGLAGAGVRGARS